MEIKIRSETESWVFFSYSEKNCLACEKQKVTGRWTDCDRFSASHLNSCSRPTELQIQTAFGEAGLDFPVWSVNARLEMESDGLESQLSVWSSFPKTVQQKAEREMDMGSVTYLSHLTEPSRLCWLFFFNSKNFQRFWNQHFYQLLLYFFLWKMEHFLPKIRLAIRSRAWFPVFLQKQYYRKKYFHQNSFKSH